MTVVQRSSEPTFIVITRLAHLHQLGEIFDWMGMCLTVVAHHGITFKENSIIDLALLRQTMVAHHLTVSYTFGTTPMLYDVDRITAQTVMPMSCLLCRPCSCSAICLFPFIGTRTTSCETLTCQTMHCILISSQPWINARITLPVHRMSLQPLSQVTSKCVSTLMRSSCSCMVDLSFACPNAIQPMFPYISPSSLRPLRRLGTLTCVTIIMVLLRRPPLRALESHYVTFYNFASTLDLVQSRATITSEAGFSYKNTSSKCG